VWVVDAPLFEPADEATASGDVAVGSGAWTAVHHAFTSPQPSSRHVRHRPGQALAYAYDIVCNGNEIGGGSIRIHREDVQKRVFAVMGIDRGGGAGEVRLPARRVQVRRPAARRHRVRLGPDLWRCSPAPTRSAT
jgi:aspartyl-tRNA synthetase